MISVRYDEKKGIYRDCKWCRGKGCQACPGERDKEYKRQFPQGPVPIATFDITTQVGIDEAKKYIHGLLNPPPPSAKEQHIIDQIKNGFGWRHDET